MQEALSVSFLSHYACHNRYFLSDHNNIQNQYTKSWHWLMTHGAYNKQNVFTLIEVERGNIFYKIAWCLHVYVCLWYNACVAEFNWVKNGYWVEQRRHWADTAKINKNTEEKKRK